MSNFWISTGQLPGELIYLSPPAAKGKLSSFGKGSQPLLASGFGSLDLKDSGIGSESFGSI